MELIASCKSHRGRARRMAPQRDHPIPERGERVVEAGAFHCIPTPLIRRFVNPL